MSMRIQEVVDGILAAVPGERLANTVDTFKSGDPAAPCTGIVTTFMATLPVLKRAADLGANLVGKPIHISERCRVARSPH